MSEFNLDNETATRIARAVEILPNIETGRFIEILINNLGEELNTESLKNITVTHLKTGMGSLDGEEDVEDIGIGLAEMKDAVRILWGDDPETSNVPVSEPYKEGDIPGSIRVAVASNSGENLDGHFGSCLRYLVYQVSPGESRLIDVRSANGAEDADEKITFRINLIKDCHIAYLISVGGPAAGKVVQAGIYPMKIEEGGVAQELIAKLQQMMSANPPPWIKKIMESAV